MATPREDVKARIEAIEESYEFFLAYAAQGLTSDQGAKSGAMLRDFIKKIERALDGLGDSFRELAASESLEPRGAWDDMLRVVANDASDALAAVRLVASRSGISSQLIDNLNANIHLRALLTDLFLVDDLIDKR
ncbi:MAG: hypothetical protein FJ207_11045 [Gemmatimonadetes bacterium]|nr:hypothetical protein [Gemmatimonadota bacterium]